MPVLPGLSPFQPITSDVLKDVVGKNMQNPSVASIATYLTSDYAITWQPIYDRVEYPQAGTTNLQFFSNVRGTSATLITGGATATRIKNFRDTNLDQAGFMSMKGFIMVALGISYIPLGYGTVSTSALNYCDDIQRLAYGGYLELDFIDMPYLRIGLDNIGDKDRTPAVMASTANNAIMFVAGGMGKNPFDIDPVYFIAPQENFSCFATLDGTALNIGSVLDVKLTLYGYQIRPAQ